jgi:hypothetical protein
LKVRDLTYRHHGQEDKASGRGFLSPVAGIHKAVDGRSGQDETAGQVADDGDMVGLGGVGGDDDKDASNDEEVVDNGPPGICGEGALGLNLGDDGGDEGNDPRELKRLASIVTAVSLPGNGVCLD